MAQAAPPKDQKDIRQTASQLTPPDEAFWQRYSPHAEFPLSSVGSFVLHVLVFGIMGLMAWLGALWFNNANRSLPVEAVRLDLGGGGGHTKGSGNDPNRGEPVENGTQNSEKTPENQSQTEDVSPTPIKVEHPSAKVKEQFNSQNIRFLEMPDTDAAKKLQRFGDVAARLRLPDRSNASGLGKGGTGSGGGSGSGEGTGTGSGKGDGRGTLTQREKRMLRWSMLFNTDSGQDYVAQLNGLGAILAFPVREQGDKREYKVVKNLKARPAKLEDEDLSKIQRIYWIDDKPQSVRDVMFTLGIRIPHTPSHFVAFMPEELEKKLYDMEKAYLNRHYKGKSEDSIAETKFRIKRGSFEPEVTSLQLTK